MRIRMILALLLLSLVHGGIFGWKYWVGLQVAARAQAQQSPPTVTAAEVRRERWQPRLRAVGSLVALQGIFVNNEVPGQVEAINFESGAEVEADALLLELDSSIEQAELEGLQAQRRLAQLEFNRNRELLQDNSISKSDYDASRARLQQIEASISAKRAQVDLLLPDAREVLTLPRSAITYNPYGDSVFRLRPAETDS